MQNPFMLPPRERLQHWKNFRVKLSSLSDDEQLRHVAAYWAQAPLQTYALDIEHPEGWLTPWELIHAGDFCRNAIALAMEMTLRLAGWDAARLELLLIKDIKLEDIFMTLKVDGKYLLNYTHASIAALQDNEDHIVVQGKYAWDGHQYSQK